MTYSAVALPPSVFLHLEMTEKTDIDRYPHMFSLYNIRVATPAVKLNSGRLPGKVRLVVKDYIPPCDIFRGFYESPFVAARLQAFTVRHVGEGPGIISTHYEAQLAGYSIQRPVFMAFQAWYHVVRRPLPLVVKRLHEMTISAYRRIRYHDFPQEEIPDHQKAEDYTYSYSGDFHRELPYFR